MYFYMMNNYFGYVVIYNWQFLTVMSEEEWCNVKYKYVAGILLQKTK